MRKVAIGVLFFLIIFILGNCIESMILISDYFAHSSSAFNIPDLDTGFIPQGLAYDHGTEKLFLSGYMDNGIASPIYVADIASSSFERKILLMRNNGERFNGHSGGLSIFEEKVYIAGSTEACLYFFEDDALINDSTTIELSGRVDLRCDAEYIRASFAGADESMLYIGEFHNEPFFRTSRKHLVEIDDKKQQAYLLGVEFKNEYALPKRAYSIPDNIQGVCFCSGYLFLSQSRGFLPGAILAYNMSELEQNGSVNVLGTNTPLFILDEEKACKTTVIPPMPEGITIVDKNIYIVYEAAARRYKIGKFIGLDCIYKTPIDYML